MKITDEIVARALGWKKQNKLERTTDGTVGRGIYPWVDGKDFGQHALPAFTTSLDVIVEEIEVRGLRWYVIQQPPGNRKMGLFHAQVMEDKNGHSGSNGGETAPLALCAALLAYLKSSRTKKGGKK